MKCYPANERPLAVDIRERQDMLQSQKQTGSPALTQAGGCTKESRLATARCLVTFRDWTGFLEEYIQKLALQGEPLHELVKVTLCDRPPVHGFTSNGRQCFLRVPLSRCFHKEIKRKIQAQFPASLQLVVWILVAWWLSSGFPFTLYKNQVPVQIHQWVGFHQWVGL